MAAYRRVYDSRHLQADCQEPGSAPKPYAWQSTMGYLYLFIFYSTHLFGEIPPKLTIPPKAAAKLCALNPELKTYHGNLLLRDIKRIKLFVIKQSEGCKSTPKMHQNAFVGRAPPGHAERAYVLPLMRSQTPISREWGPTSHGGGANVLFFFFLAIATLLILTTIVPPIPHDMIRDAILTCARKPTWVR